MDQPINTTAEFEAFLMRLKDAQPVDLYEYKQNFAFALEEIEKDWSNSGHHDVAGSYHVLMDKFFDENPGYKDSDGDITEEGFAALDEYSRPIKEAAAREMVGEPTKPDLSMANPEHAAQAVHTYLEEAGLEVSPIGGSGKSASKYFEVLAADGERKKVRVADHPLPVEYLDANGAADYELSLYDLTSDVRYDGRSQSTRLDEEAAISRIVDLIERVKSDAQLRELATPRQQNAPAPEDDISEAIANGLAIESLAYEILPHDDARFPFVLKTDQNQRKRCLKSRQDAEDAANEFVRSASSANARVISLAKQGYFVTKDGNGRFMTMNGNRCVAVNALFKSEAINAAELDIARREKERAAPKEIPMYVRNDLPDELPGYQRFWHGAAGHSPISKITDDGLFGGLFAAYSEDSAHGPGNPWRYYYMDIKESDRASHDDLARDFDADSKPAVEALREFTKDWVSDEDLLNIAEKVIDDTDSWIFDHDEPGRSKESIRISEMLSAPCDWPGEHFNGKNGDNGALGWFMQKLRGAVAKAYGYKAVNMNDEHGISVLVLPGVEPKKVDIENPEFDFSKFEQSNPKTWRQFKNEPTASASFDKRDPRESQLTKISFDPAGVALPDFAGCYEKVGNCYRREDTGREFAVEKGVIRLPIDATKADISAAASLLEIAGIKDVSISGELADQAWQEISSRGIESAGREAPKEARKEELPALDRVVEVEKRQLTECDEQVACR